MRGIREWRRKRSEWSRVKGHLWSYRIILSLIEADVSVEDLDEELNLQGGVHALVSDLQSLLQAFHHPPPITDLTTEEKKLISVLTVVNGLKLFHFILAKSHLSQLHFSAYGVMNWIGKLCC